MLDRRKVVLAFFIHSIACVCLFNISAREIKDLWLEYEDCTTEEARVVKDFDKLEMLVQADEYEQGESDTSSQPWNDPR